MRRLWPALAVGAVLAAIVAIVIRERLGIAFGELIVTVLVLPMAAGDLGDTAQSPDRPRRLDYGLAILPAVLLTAIFAPVLAALVVAVVAISMLASVELLRAIRVPTRVGVALVIVQACLFLSWPIWASDLLLHFDPGVWLQRVIDVSPTFAINTAIAPTQPFTHRPWMYALTNLGQDVPYAMPKSVWPSVLLHGAISVAGLAAGWISRRWTRMNADGDKADEAQSTSS